MDINCTANVAKKKTECKKHGFPSKRIKIDSLIPEIFESGSTTLVKNSVKQGVLAVRNAGRFSINDQYRFLDDIICSSSFGENSNH